MTARCSHHKRIVGGCRGQAAVVGVVLMFGLLIALLALVQLTAVPGWNQAVEVQHNERVQSDMQLVGTEIHRSSVTGQSRTVPVELGVRYPSRPLLFNPTDPAGTLRTTDSGEFEIRNVDIEGVNNYWNDTEDQVIEGSTRQLVYEPRYNEYSTPPTTVYENGVLYNEFERPLTLDEGGFVDGHRISLITLSGDYHESSVETRTVSLKPESAPTQTVSVESVDSEPVTVSVPTRLPETEWESILEPEFQRNGGHVLDDEDGVTVANGTLTVAFDPDVEYDLQLARVGVGQQSQQMEPYYITQIAGSETPLRAGQSERLVFEVRDRFNNPAKGVDVDFETSDGHLSQTTGRTGTDGQVMVRYTAPQDAGTQTVTASADVEAVADRQNDQSTVQIAVTDDDADDDGFVGSNPGPGSGKVQLVDSVRDGTGVDLTLRNTGTSEMSLTQIRASFYYPSDQSAPPTEGGYSYQGFETTYDIPGEFVSVEGPSLAPDGGEDSISLTDLRQNPGGDFMVIHTVWVDELGESHAYSYFVGIER